MIRFSKTLSQTGIYLLLTSLMPVMIFSIIMITLKDFVNKGYELLWKLGEWLKEISNTTLNSITSIGWLVLIICLIAYFVLIFNLTLINSRKSYKQRIGYLLSLVFGLSLFIISLLPLIIAKSINIGDSLSNLVLGLLAVFIGLNSAVLAIGSIVGLISAKTSIDNYEIKEKNR
ncbi:hypothetical protein [Spiroplasma monobiae]|uniref:Transmembrane protein n=1 Tax=Spiroplasma monobiae MQ-1 TaxID=1336748 RepID=A0A2K9LUM5_SPISQ|nr:hypothetical protein [Spiroplasma monobiae]AUM62749.1 hypothetical protein SMONO_v1c05000 [Spiroplasma monobiae MQ-1]